MKQWGLVALYFKQNCRRAFYKEEARRQPRKAKPSLVARILLQAQQVYLRLQQRQQARLAHHEGVELHVAGLELVYARLGIEQAPALQVKPTHALAGQLGGALVHELGAQRGLREAASRQRS